MAKTILEPHFRRIRLWMLSGRNEQNICRLGEKGSSLSTALWPSATLLSGYGKKPAAVCRSVISWQGNWRGEVYQAEALGFS